jgi:hypothetical protein
VGGQRRIELALELVVHDDLEAEVGDIPSPTSDWGVGTSWIDSSR